VGDLTIAAIRWQRALRELAVVIAADWQRLGLAR
jgi:hypothetical protein